MEPAGCAGRSARRGPKTKMQPARRIQPLHHKETPSDKDSNAWVAETINQDVQASASVSKRERPDAGWRPFLLGQCNHSKVQSADRDCTPQGWLRWGTFNPQRSSRMPTRD
ncbi:hypothetical protein VTN49DRAFT_445 [Thermomyces lanuginosus]|uniref:uncharacterized protein n=1 Tax=Thermomyces lanuginosus TaxID=5541 RepID=UPI003742EDC9